MKKHKDTCIDCGSEPVSVVRDDVKPIFTMEIVKFACGAVLKKMHSTQGNIGRSIHSGCTAES